MIGLIFSLSFMLMFMLAVMVTDLILMVKEEFRVMEQSMGKDTSIFPDYEPWTIHQKSDESTAARKD